MFGFSKNLFKGKHNEIKQPQREDQSKILSFEQTQEVSKALGLVGKDLSHLIINTHKATGLRGEDLVSALKSLTTEEESRIVPLHFLKEGSYRKFRHSVTVEPPRIGSIHPFSSETPIEEELINKIDKFPINEKCFSFDYKKVEHIPREIVEQIREANPSISDDLIASMFKDCEFVKGAI